MPVILSIASAVVAAILCHVGHGLGARADLMLNALRVIGGTLLFAMAASAATEQMWLGVTAAILAGIFVSLGGIDILRHELGAASDGAEGQTADSPAARDGDTQEMPVIRRAA